MNRNPAVILSNEKFCFAFIALLPLRLHVCTYTNQYTEATSNKQILMQVLTEIFGIVRV
jgi:hypothetical protein